MKTRFQISRSLPAIFLLLYTSLLHAIPPVLNYAGQVAVDGEPFQGKGLFKFALIKGDNNTTIWSNDGSSVNGSEPLKSVRTSVDGGLYSILLGNSSIKGMSSLNPSIFQTHSNIKLRVWFSDGINGFEQLSPDRPFASVPYAFSAGTAQSATIADGSINKAMLGSDVLTDLNASIGMNRLSSEVTEKLNQEKTTNNYNAPSVGSLLAVPYGSDAPAGYSLYQRGEKLVWEEKAPVSVARHAYDGMEVLDGKIYFVGGVADDSTLNIAERYDPVTNTWETLTPMSVARKGFACAILNGKFYAIGGQGVSSVEVYDPSTESWSTGVALPSEVKVGTAVTVNGKIYLIGGKNSSDQNINQVLCFDPSSNQWTAKAIMPTARHGMKLVWFENRIWAIGGNGGSHSNQVESYNPSTDSWRVETSLIIARHWPVAWVTNGKIYCGGGSDSSGSRLNSIEEYDPYLENWSVIGNLPENKFVAGSVVLNDEVYVVSGSTANGVFSNKVYAADLNASVYDLYRKDGNAPVGTPVVQSEYADGSVTGSKMADGAITTDKLNEQILKYLKPEITSQPQAQTVYADTNATFSVTAEGKFLTYQWKKDGADLTGETNATLNITDANATLHDGNYSVVVSNDFGSVESDITEFLVSSFSVNSIPNIELWLDSSDSSTITLNNGKVSIWHDKSGNENNATQTLVNKQPEFGQDQNGKFVRFTSSYTSGVIDSVLADNYLILSPVSGKSSFFVIDHDGSKLSMLLGSKDSHKSYILIGSDLYALSIDGYKGGSDGYKGGSGPSDIGSWWFNGAFQSTGGDLGASGQIPLNTPSLHSVIYQLNDPMFPFYRIGSYRDNKAGFGGKIREIIIFNGYLTEADRQKIEGYLSNKWGLTGNLPLNHPYKGNVP